ncbi:hypothetical protein CT157_16125 [Pseudomonas syringae]|uniref:Uncharacterized protein n=1 Tax=Pseudomonas syringae TaxID=317 RepID=A0A3T0JVH6_PSESX|nr:hypothetical protein CT157_16125 [Pseudomonas syringae]
MGLRISQQPSVPIVPTLCVGMPPWTLRVHCDAERHGMHSHAERGNDQRSVRGVSGNRGFVRGCR